MKSTVACTHVPGGESPSRALSRFLAGLRFEALPPRVVCRAEEASLDWLACAVAGRGAWPICVLEQFASTTGPEDGRRIILRAWTLRDQPNVCHFVV